jgi:hypothetical protein
MSPLRRRLLVLAAAPLTSALALTGCAGAPEKVVVTVTVAPTPTPFASPKPTATPTPVASAPAPAPVVPDPTITPNAPAEPIPEGPAHDLGPAPSAMGPTTSDGDGNLLTYTVVAGDAFFDIAQRFDVPQQQLLRMNPSIHDLGQNIYIGQIVNLDWTTTR